MKRHIYQFILLLLFFLIQTAAARVWSDDSYFIPQLVLLFTIIFSLTRPLRESLWYAFAAGFFLELFSGLYFGAHIFSLVLSALVVYVVTRNFTVRDLGVGTAVLLAACGAVFLPLALYGYQGLMAFFGFASGPAARDFFSFALFFTAVLNVLLIYPLRLIFKLLPQDEGPV